MGMDLPVKGLWMFFVGKQYLKKDWCVIGHLGMGKSLINGQTIKTKILYDSLIEKFGEQRVCFFDTHKKTTIIFMPLVIFLALRRSRNIIILPAHNGIKVIVPLLVFENRLFHRKLYYSVIGGWLSQYIDHCQYLKTQLQKLDIILVETSTMKTELKNQGFQNVTIMPNFKKLHIIPKEKVIFQSNEPYRLCTFSRVSIEKGIEDAAKAVFEVNKQYGRDIFTLDIYGPVDNNQKEWFSRLKASFPVSISYCEEIPYDKSTETLAQYFALLFPTKYSTEGIPGTIIDAYAAGLPVIASNWNSVSDIIEDGKTGLIFPMGDCEVMKSILVRIFQNPCIINDMKNNCLARAIQYTPENVLRILIAE